MNGSAKISAATRKEVPCRRKFRLAFAASHANLVFNYLYCIFILVMQQRPAPLGTRGDPLWNPRRQLVSAKTGLRERFSVSKSPAVPARLVHLLLHALVEIEAGDARASVFNAASMSVTAPRIFMPAYPACCFSRAASVSCSTDLIYVW
jgi:hypothetical protein